MIEIKSLKFTYEGTKENILDEINLEIHPGHCVAILGNNGVGKSTLLKCINRIYKVRSGTVLVDGKNIFQMSRREMAKYIAYVPQNGEISHTMVFDAVLLGRRPYIKWDVTEEDKQIVADILEQFGLKEYASRYLNELSGGELQKVMLARAMAQQPRFLLLDEPTSNLDPYNQHQILRNIRQISQKQEIGVAVVIHDLNLAVRYCDRFLFLKDSRVYSYGGVETFTPETIKNVYGINSEIIEHQGIKIIVPNENF